MRIKRICWDCPEAPIREWRINSESKASGGHLISISCPNCKKESRIFGWMAGCECKSCKSQIIGAAK